MTEAQHKEERLAAWDDYSRTREKLLALRSRIARWNQPLGGIYSRVFSHAKNAREDDFKGFPSHEEYMATVQEMKQTQATFSRLRKQAIRFRFAVEPDEDLIK